MWGAQERLSQAFTPGVPKVAVVTKAESLLLDPSCALPQEDAAAEREGREGP